MSTHGSSTCRTHVIRDKHGISARALNGYAGRARSRRGCRRLFGFAAETHILDIGYCWFGVRDVVVLALVQ